MPVMHTELSAGTTTSPISVIAGKYHVDVSGTFGVGVTVKLQRRCSDDADWVDVDGETWTAAAGKTVELGNCQIRFNVASGPSSDINISMAMVR